MSHRVFVLVFLAGCAIDNHLVPVSQVGASSSTLAAGGQVVHVGMSGAACAFSTASADGGGADVGFYDDETPIDVAVFDTRDNAVLLALDGDLAVLQDYSRARKLGLSDRVVDAAFTDEGWVALTEGCALVTRGGILAAAPGCGRLETHAGALWLRGRGAMWPIAGVTAGEPRSIDAMYIDPQGQVYEATAGQVVGPAWSADLDAVELFALEGGIGAEDRAGRIWRLDVATGDIEATAIALQPGSITTSEDGWVLLHQTADMTTWYGR